VSIDGQRLCVTRVTLLSMSLLTMNNSFQIICARLPDHQGVPNATLVNEHSPLAAKYDNKSVAEQNSVDLAWDIFMSDKFQNLRSCICCDEEEFKRFRQLGMLAFASIVSCLPL